MKNTFNLCFLDIETSPLIGYSWRVWDTSLIKVVQDWHLLSFAYKFRGDRKVTVVSLQDFPRTYRADKTNDEELAKKLWKILDKADAIVAHNGNRFDIPKIKAKLLQHGLTPPSPFKSIDTCAIAKRQFSFTSNKLGELGELLGCGKKAETGGFGLWEKCLAGDRKAFARLCRYNARDVTLLEDVYDKLKAWAPTHPNINLKNNPHGHNCPACGSDNVQRRGWEYIKAFRAQRFQCVNPGCGKWSKGDRERIPGKLLT